jgi:hypothetical protein
VHYYLPNNSGCRVSLLFQAAATVCHRNKLKLHVEATKIALNPNRNGNFRDCMSTVLILVSGQLTCGAFSRSSCT